METLVNKVDQYFKLKQRQKEIENELTALRQALLDHFEEQGKTSFEIGDYAVKLIEQERRKYHMDKIFTALPDPNLWRLFTKVDQAKLDSLIKLNVVSEQSIQDTYALQKIQLLRVDKQ